MGEALCMPEGYMPCRIHQLPVQHKPPVDDAFLDSIAQQESKAERSLMHRFSLAHDLLSGDVSVSKMVAVAVWLRLSAKRLLTWNRNYNVKPREISAAQDRLTNRLAEIYEGGAELQGIVRLAMAAVGRGGQGDVGQRIRDEILHVQSRNHAKGGMMEEWHQKLHNNTSPDDVVICRALIAYIESGLDVAAYWDTLQAENITCTRLASFDRAIKSEPRFEPEQCEGLLKDLKAYLITLKAVHSGEDFEAAANTVMGYRQESVKGKAIDIPPVKGVATEHLAALLSKVLPRKDSPSEPCSNRLQNIEPKASQDASLEDRLHALLAVRQELHCSIQKGNGACGSRLRDVLFLDIALESAARQAVEKELGSLKADAGGDVAGQTAVAALALQNAVMSLDADAELDMCSRALQAAMSCSGRTRLLRLIAACDRLRRHLGDLAAETIATWQPPADALASKLRVERSAVAILGEEVARSSAAAPLAQLVSALEPALRSAAGLGSWQLVSPAPGGSVRGEVVAVAALADVQGSSFSRPTVLLADVVGGDEDIPEGVVAVVTGNAPDVLSHAAVRARNSSVMLAACHEEGPLQQLRGLAGRSASVCLMPSQDGGEMDISEGAAAVDSSTSTGQEPGMSQPPQVTAKRWCGKFALTSAEFSPDSVGAKSLNTQKLKGKVPDEVGLPASVALPFGSFEAVLQDAANASISKELESAEEGSCSLQAIRAAVQKLQAPSELRAQLAAVFQSEGLPLVSDSAWELSWAAIKSVWASKWNERAMSSMRKAGLDHSSLQMALLCQQIVPASYAFVAHTKHPTTGDADVMFVELVQGLGETLVSNTPGAAFRFTAKKGSIKDGAAGEGRFTVEGYPSKSHVLVAKAKWPVIFRSDSNGEDLEGYAGAGLFDSVLASAPGLVLADSSTDRLLNDEPYQQQLLRRIALAAVAVEEAMGGVPQDIEGVVDAEDRVHIVQARPQV